MKTLLLTVAVIITLCLPSQAAVSGHAFGFCENGNQVVTTGGLNSTTKVQRSYPSCGVTVYNGSGTSLATLFLDANGTPLANPFTATTSGKWEFYASDGYYTVSLNGGGLTVPVTAGLYTVLSTTGSGWTYTPSTNYPSVVGSIFPTAITAGTDNPIVIAGAASTDVTNSQAYMVGVGGIAAVGSALNSTVIRMGVVNGSYGYLSVDKSGTATFKPLRINVNGSDAITVQTTGNTSFGTTADNGYRVDVQGTLNASGVTTVGSTGQFSVDALGNLIKIRAIAYSWPSIQGAASTFLQNDGSGNLSWSSGGAGSITGSGTANLGTKFTAGTVIGNSTYYDDGTSSSIGTLAASDNPTTIRLEVEKDQNNATSILVRNATSGTLGLAAYTARSGSANDDATFGVTSALFTTSSGLTASAGYIYTGNNATGGFIVQTGATNSSIYLKAGGSTTVVQVDTGGLQVTGTTKFNSLTYTWPASQSAGTFLTTNGSGTLSWSAVGGGGGGLGGSGTVGLAAIWTAGTSLGNATIYDTGGSTTVGTLGPSDDVTRIRFEVEKDQNESTGLLVRNNTSGTLARAAIIARSGSASNDISLGVTSATYTTSGGVISSNGFLYTGVNTTAGLVIQTGAGAIYLEPAGTTVRAVINTQGVDITGNLNVSAAGTTSFGGLTYTWPASQTNGYVLTTNGSGTLTWTAAAGGVSGSGTASLVPRWSAGTTLTNSTIYDDGTSTTVGTSVASDDPTRIRFEVEKDQNESTGLLVRNNTSGTLARSAIIARSGSTSNDISMGVTSATYTTSGGLAASTGFIVTGTSASSGILVYTDAGPISFRTAGSTTDDCAISTGDRMTCGSFAGVGTALTSINMASVTGTLAMGNGGTGGTSFSNQVIPFSNGSNFTSSGGLLWDGSFLIPSALKTQTISSTGILISFALIGGGPGSGTYFTVGNSGMGSTGTTALRVATDNNNFTSAVTLGAADSCGAGFRCMKVPN